MRPRAHAQFLQVDEAAEAGRDAATELVVAEGAADARMEAPVSTAHYRPKHNASNSQ